MFLKLLQAHLCRHRMSSQLLLLLCLPLDIPETPGFHDMLFHLDLRVKWHLFSSIGKKYIDLSINFYLCLARSRSKTLPKCVQPSIWRLDPRSPLCSCIIGSQLQICVSASSLLRPKSEHVSTLQIHGNSVNDLYSVAGHTALCG